MNAHAKKNLWFFWIPVIQKHNLQNFKIQIDCSYHGYCHHGLPSYAMYLIITVEMSTTFDPPTSTL